MTDIEIINAMQSIDRLSDRDTALEAIWAQLEDVPMDPNTELTEAPFGIFPAGTFREDIWHWFDERYSKGVAALLYGDGAGVDRSEDIAHLLFYKDLSEDCETRDCAYNHDGVCRFAMVHQRRPVITEDDGCTEGVIDAFADATKKCDQPLAKVRITYSEEELEDDDIPVPQGCDAWQYMLGIAARELNEDRALHADNPQTETLREDKAAGTIVLTYHDGTTCTYELIKED